jgi:serine/threonine-protein kinase
VSPEPALVLIAQSIADGSPIDWDAAESRASGEDRAVIRQLRVLADLAALHRSLPSSPGDTAPASVAREANVAPAIGSWAHLALRERLGHGASGEVYRAWDRQLEREVALKLLHVDEVTDDPQASRLAMEARLLARLHHPNVVTVHGVAIHDGRVAFWMELVRGATLEQLLLKRGSFGAREAALIGIDLCRALAAIHAAGLIHRDVKAQNVMREDGGRIVLMDLGTGREIDPSRGRRWPDLAGTPLYLAPEIFSGAPASERSDLYSLGVLLYHLVTGSFPVRATTIEELQEGLAKGEVVRLRDARADLPTTFVSAVNRAISSDPDRRYASAGAFETDLVNALEDRTPSDRSTPTPGEMDARQLPSGVIEADAGAADGKEARVEAHASRTPAFVTEVGARHWNRRLAAGTAVMVAMVVVAIVSDLWRTRAVPGTSGATATRLMMPLSVPLSDSPLPSLAISPDATRVVYVGSVKGTTKLYLRAMNNIESEPLPGTDGALGPFFSPDGAAVGFFASGKLRLLSLADRAVTTLCDAPDGRGGSWGSDNRIVFAPGTHTGLFQISAIGGKPEPLTTLLIDKGERTHRWPHVLPGNAGVIFTIAFAETSSYDDASIAVVSLTNGERKILAKGTFPAYLPPGYLIYAREGSVLAVPFDARRLELLGAPVPALRGVESRPLSGTAVLGVSKNGTLIYASTSETAKRRLVWSDRQGNATPVTRRETAYAQPRLSPAGHQIVVTVTGDDGTSDLWIHQIDRDTLSRLTFGGINEYPVWSPDERQIVFASRKDSPVVNLWSINADGSGGAVRLRPSASRQLPTSWSPDGKFLAFTELTPQTGLDVSVMRMDDTHAAQPFLNGPYNEFSAVFSPDNQRVAYVSDETGRAEVYVRPFSDQGPKVQISNDGGAEPVWSSIGTELYFRNGTKMMRAPVRTGGQFSAGRPIELFDARYDLDRVGLDANFDIARDAQRFLMIRGGESGPAPLTVVLNWFEEVAHLVPVGGKR